MTKPRSAAGNRVTGNKSKCLETSRKFYLSFIPFSLDRIRAFGTSGTALQNNAMINAPPGTAPATLVIE